MNEFFYQRCLALPVKILLLGSITLTLILWGISYMSDIKPQWARLFSQRKAETLLIEKYQQQQQQLNRIANSQRITPVNIQPYLLAEALTQLVNLSKQKRVIVQSITPSPFVTKDAISQQLLQLSLQGNFRQLVAWLQALNQEKFLVRIEQLQFEPQSSISHQLALTLTLQIFYP